MKALVTGGAGFIGSHLVDYLLKQGIQVKVLDNLSSGNIDNLAKCMDNPLFEFIEADLLEKEKLSKLVDDCDQVFHFAANPEVDAKKAAPIEHFKQNIEATFNLLEAMRLSGKQMFIAFASTSTVYGDADQLPTREDYGPLIPISLYGASKLACEGLLSAYASMYGFKAFIYRLANVVGPRSNHGVIYDFVHKLNSNPDTLEVLGDGSQSKSYLYIDDCVSGFMYGVRSGETVGIYNVGSEDRTNVLEIAEIVKKETGLESAKIQLTGGVDGGRGWKGDVKIMQLDMNRLKDTGWKPKYGSTDAVRLTAKSVIDTIK